MTAKLLPISVIIVTNRHDERFLACLRSVGWASEIVIVDNDAGLQVSELPSAARTKIHPFSGKITDFAQARNQAGTHATQPWVFFLDSDEVVADDAVPAIEKVLASSVAGAQIRRKDIFHGQELRHGEVGQVWLIRLAKKDTIKFTRPVHEIAEVKGEAVRSSIVVFHHAHKSVADFFRAVSEYAQIEAKYRHEHHQRFNWRRMILFPLGKACLNFFFRLGFLDGLAGLTYLVMMSFHSLLVSVFLYEYEIKT